ncbi:MAG: hypothetical protein ACFFCM_00830 [Promethearchaeota archaeon]
MEKTNKIKNAIVKQAIINLMLRYGLKEKNYSIDRKGRVKRLKITSKFTRRGKLTNIPVDIGKLIDLEKLDLSNNKINKIENLENLTNLNKLILNGNNINKIEALGNLSQLEHFEIFNNPLDKEDLEISEFGAKTAVDYCLKKKEKKFEKLLSISDKLSFDTLQMLLKIDRATLLNKIISLAEEYEIVIDGDNIIIDKYSAKDLVKLLSP